MDLSGNWIMVVNSDSSEVQIPYSYPIRGTRTFQKMVVIDSEMLRSHAWHLNLFGVVDEIEVRVNGRFIQRYPGGLIPFQVHIPDRALQEGSNIIELTVTDLASKSYIALQRRRFGQRIATGIVREVVLVGTPQVWVSDVHIVSDRRSNSGLLTVNATVSGNAVERLIRMTDSNDVLIHGKAPVQVEVVARRFDNGEVVARSHVMTASIEKSRSERFSLPLSLPNRMKWTPANPSLYLLEVSVSVGGSVIDRHTTYHGFRTIDVRSLKNGNAAFFINDSLITVNAVEYVTDYPNLGSTLAYHLAENDVSLLKTLGVNAIKIRHEAPHPYFVHLCDRYGIMILADLPVVDLPTSLLSHEEIAARSRNAAERMVAWYDTHPSVIAYGVYEGMDEENQSIQSLLASIEEPVRLYGTKLLYKTVPEKCVDFMTTEGFDFVVVRCYDSRQSESFRKVVAQAAMNAGKAAVLMSYGALISPANLNGFSDPLSHESQAVALRDCYRTTLETGLAGSVFWSFNDYHLELPTMLADHYDPYVATTGLVDIWRQQRVAYAMLKSLINDEKEPLLQARDHSPGTPLLFISTGLIVALLLTFLINRSRRFREYLIRAIIRPYNFYADIRDQRILSGTQTTILGLIISACVGLVLSSMMYFLRTDQKVEYLIQTLVPSASAFELIRFVSWNPAVSVLVWAVCTFLCFILYAIILRIGAFFVRGKIYFKDTFTIAVWSALPLIILLPVGVTLYQLLSTDAISLFIPLTVLLTCLWFFYRSLLAASVVFDVPPLPIYVVGVGLLLSVVVIAWTVLDQGSEFSAYLGYYLSVVAN